jgi:Leucine-rich repeat (LRR) protein
LEIKIKHLEANMKKTIKVICLISLFFYPSMFIYSDIPVTERAALIALYNSTNGDNWTNNSGWKTPPLHIDGFAIPGTEDRWYGIWVVSGHVVEIHLSSNTLTGSLPSNLENLTHLQTLNLGIAGSTGNYITGTIPKELGNLLNLKKLILGGNEFIGTIPKELGKLINLHELYLWNNCLRGTIPNELSNLSNLQSINLAVNLFSGFIPAWLGNLTNLESLGLAFNSFAGEIPPNLGYLSNLDYLNLSQNGLSGAIPSTFGNLVSLSYLDLGENSLSGSIPSSLGNLTNLRSLILNKNNLSGFIPSTLGNLINLRALYLQYNLLSGEIPKSLMNLTEISNLDIGYNCLYSNDYDLRLWLNAHDPDWENHQNVCSYDSEFPFGSFDTPIGGSTVSSSIPVTGWALDDTGIKDVKIYREQQQDLIYIGTALQVEGARPDVAIAYPNYPNNTKAGWGYMMLTNFLPNSGNGTFVLHAIATDVMGKTTTLGIKTIYCDNANAIKPFGAIDTPAQGGTASGSSYVNWGWVLTPQPNSIPTDGSTIDVWVDGVNLGHPTYNNYRADIANKFPGYANSDGAIGYFFLDTTAYANGVHTIQWTAKDSGGNTDGIGSRYFTIQNTGADASVSEVRIQKSEDRIDLSGIGVDTTGPVLIQKGFEDGNFDDQVYADDSGRYSIQIRELEPLRIKFTEGFSIVACYHIAGNKLRNLPAGMNIKDNTINWMPGIAYFGNYEFVVVVRDKHGELSKKFLPVTIDSKFDNLK